jgi:hypothetical protein
MNGLIVIRDRPVKVVAYIARSGRSRDDNGDDAAVSHS